MNPNDVKKVIDNLINELGLSIVAYIVDFRIIFTLSGVGGNSDSRLSRRAVAIRRSLLQNKCKLNCIFHYNSGPQLVSDNGRYPFCSRWLYLL